MSRKRSTRSVTVLSDGVRVRRDARHHPEVHRPALLEQAGQLVVRRRREHVEVDRDAGGTGPGQQPDGHVGGAAVRDRGGTGLGHRGEDPLQRAGWRAGASTERCRWKPEAVGTRPASTAGSAGSSTCTTRSASGIRRRTSATWPRSPSASASASSRRAPRSASTRSPRGRSTVAASVHGPATWILNGPA